MDIGIFHPELIYPRGAEKQVCKLSYYLNKMGHEITIYTFQKENDYIFDPLIKDIELISLNKKWAINLLFGANYPRWIYLIKKMSTKLKKHDIINAHNHPAQWISKYTDIPTVWMCNEPYYDDNKGLRFFYNRIDAEYSSNVQLTLAISPEIENVVKNRYPQLKVDTVGSGADLERRINHIQNNHFDLIFVGPLHPKKRQLDIIKAFTLIKNEIPNARLHFVGGNVGFLSNRYKKSMIDLSTKNDLDILFYNSVSDEELYRLYDIADIAVFVPELEPWGIFPLETILGGIPTVISNQCGIKNILPSNYPIVEKGNIKQLADSILKIYENQDLYKKRTFKASKMIEKNYSWESYSRRMESYFQKTI